MLFTGYDVEVSPILGPLRRKNHAYNDGVRAHRGTATVPWWWTMPAFAAYAKSRMWGPDRLHMSKAGHKYLAAQVLDILEVPH